ncbi:MAG: hydantoinase B/oxoprolinase family protein [Cyclobacteriaceae bacterium]|jgi:5-oxoprolinase (ATP-hydrolysing)|nr:hydantoinase B/oxoprolinase family protein [Cyclobacteriaceae bacterium]
MNPAWHIWIDTGGTFTDCIARDPHGQIHRLKILSSSCLRGTVKHVRSPHQLVVTLAWPTPRDIFEGYRLVHQGNDYPVKSVDVRHSVIHLREPIRARAGDVIDLRTDEEVPVLAARLLTQTKCTEAFPPIDLRLGSTRGTNALLERKGARTALLITEGFTDLLRIGNQTRPHLFALDIQKEKPLYEVAIAVPERIRSSGRIEKKLTPPAMEKIIRQLKRAKVESVAICLLNSYKNPAHEKQLCRLLANAGFVFVTASHQLTRQVRLLPRAETTVANAYLQPVISQYLQGIRQGLSGARVRVMASNGALLSMDGFMPKDSLLSGPAGGVVGAALAGKQCQRSRLITFDMGGTSTDVSLYDRQFSYRYESAVGQRKILAPSLAIETIAAGGGSICSFDGFRLTVGPHSAGAHPGPACYGAGGPLTITDVNLLLGRVDESQFAFPLHRGRSEEELQKILRQLAQKGTPSSRPALLEAFLQIANEKMAEAIRKVSVQQGHDPRSYSLLSFGGAGGQHACALASLLGISEVLVPYDAGLLSAFGIGHATIAREEEQLILVPLVDFEKRQTQLSDMLFAEAKQKLVKEGFAERDIVLERQQVFLRFRGQESTLAVDTTRGINVAAAFRKKYRQVYGHWLERPIEVESVRVSAAVRPASLPKRKKGTKRYAPTAKHTVEAWANGKAQPLAAFVWEALKPGAVLPGPALLTSRNSTVFVDEGWQLTIDENLTARLEAAARLRAAASEQPQALLELFTNRFTAIAEEMGALLQRTAFSVNVKERLDFSCALLDADGYLVVNAPHIPVHLGSLGVCVRQVSNTIAWREGDVVITNHPAFGGSHLPDVTLIKPVFAQGTHVGFVANRAHHAEIGGKRPGSMPADATHLEEEGVVIAPTYLIRQGHAQWAAIQALFTKGRYPTRAWAENQADINGALASIQFGEQALQRLCMAEGAKRVLHYMGALRDHAHALLSRHVQRQPTRTWQAVEKLDDGSALRVSITHQKKHLHIDFTGSAARHPGNLNATPAIVQSVVLYVLRVWLGQDVPMNEGLLDGITLLLPRGILNPDFTTHSPAVVGGNTEVSQRLTDTLLKALELCACSQGTMNNFLMGNAQFGYYETTGGGTGAGPGFHGADAVHQHMTNTRMTDPELMELRYPVQVESFAVRQGSGGRGTWRGGNGMVRVIRFLKTLDINVLTQHRHEKPFGMHGGEAGKPGRQYLLRANGTRQPLGGVAQAGVRKGDVLVIETPGGGGWGPWPATRSANFLPD